MFKYKVTYLRKCTHCSNHDEVKKVICAFKPLAIDTDLLLRIVNGNQVLCPRCNSPFECKPSGIVDSRITLWDQIVDYCRNKDSIVKDKLFSHLASIGIDIKIKYYTIYGYMAMLQKSGYIQRSDSSVFVVRCTIPFGLKESECLKIGYKKCEPVKSDREFCRNDNPSPFRSSYKAPSDARELVFEHAC